MASLDRGGYQKVIHDIAMTISHSYTSLFLLSMPSGRHAPVAHRSSPVRYSTLHQWHTYRMFLPDVLRPQADYFANPAVHAEGIMEGIMGSWKESWGQVLH